MQNAMKKRYPFVYLFVFVLLSPFSYGNFEENKLSEVIHNERQIKIENLLSRETVPYIYENFNSLPSGSVPEGWFTNSTFRVEPGFGLNNSRRFSRLITHAGGTPDNPNGFWQTSQVLAGENPVLSFYYRVVNEINYPSNGTPPTRFRIFVRVSDDGGINFNTLGTIAFNGSIFNHNMITNEYRKIDVPLPSYVNQDIIVEIFAERIGNLTATEWFYVDFDDVKIGSFYEAEFTVTNGTSPVNNAVISVPGKPFGPTTTDTNGNAVLNLPSGTTNYLVEATNYLSYEGVLEIEDASIIVPDIELIGNFVKTFTVVDQNDNPLSNVSVTYEGIAQSYSGSDFVEGTLLTNTSGIATVALANGNYTYSAAKDNYYTVNGEFTMNNEASTEMLQMQIYPMVTFTITGQIDDDETEPLEGASILVNELYPLSTNSSGQAFLRLPVGNHSYTAEKIGFQSNFTEFEIASNIDTILPPMLLEISPPVFSFVSPTDQILNFPKILTGQTTGALSIVFTNVGSGEITIEPSDINLVGDDSENFILQNLESSVSLISGEQATISVLFSPLSAGIKNAFVEIEDNIGNKAIQTIDLVGEAYDATTLPFLEDFETGSFNNWFVVNGAQTNKWHVGEPANDPGNLAAIISNDGGLTNAYSINSASVTHFYQDFQIPDAEPGEVKLQFDWKGLGETQDRDRLRVYLIVPSITPVAGTQLSTSPGTIQFLGSYFNQAEWQTVTQNISDEHLGQQRRLVFSWRNDSSGGTQPPATVDNIYVGLFYNLLLATNPPAAGIVSGGGEFGAGFSVPVEVIQQNGYSFENWSADAGIIEDENLLQTIFTMPAQNAILTANFSIIAPLVEDQTETYNGVEFTLTATATEGFDIIWYDDETGGNIVTPSAINAGVYTFWAAARDVDGFESERVPAVLTINPAELQIIADSQNKIYGQDDPDLTYEITAGVLYTDDELIGQLTREDGENVGEYAILQGDLNNPNYQIEFISNILSVTPANLHVIADDKLKYFDGEPFPVEDYSVSFGGFQFDDNQENLNGELQYSGSAIGAIEPGTYTIVPGGLFSDNYNIEFIEGILTISDLIPVTIEGLVAEDKVYDGLTAAVVNFNNAVLNGVDIEDEVFLNITDASAHFVSPDVGVDIEVIVSGLILDGEDSFKYALVIPELTASILQRNLVITPDAGQSKIFGDPDPQVLTYTITDGEMVEGEQLSGELTREVGESVGIYQILPGTLSGGLNYIIEFTEEVFTIYALLTLQAYPENSGVVTGGGEFLENDEIAIEAYPEEGFLFVHWIDEDEIVVSTEPDFIYIMPGKNVSLTAIFDLENTIPNQELIEINVYPNPARNYFNISSPELIKKLVIYDITGKVVYNEVVNSFEKRIHGEFNGGIYILKIYTDKSIHTKRLLIKQ
jgi:hypothetical protein